MEILKYFKTPSTFFTKFLIFIIKWLKTFKNMIKVYEISSKYIMLFMHNNIFFFTFDQFTYILCCSELYSLHPIVHREIFDIFQKYFTKYFMPKISWNFTSLQRHLIPVVAEFRVLIPQQQCDRLYSSSTSFFCDHSGGFLRVLGLLLFYKRKHRFSKRKVLWLLTEFNLFLKYQVSTVVHSVENVHMYRPIIDTTSVNV